MNEILARQNEDKFLERLAAQRQLYDEEKCWITVWIITTTLVGLIGSGALTLLKVINAYITLGAILVIAIEIVLFFYIHKRGEDAARIQELFDIELFEIPWNDMLAEKPSQTVIREAAERYTQRTTQNERERLKDWYSGDIANMPLYQARIVCQRENLGWDERQRKEYILWVSIALIILLLILVIISIAANLTAQDFFSVHLLLMLPVFTMGVKHIYDHIRAVLRLRELNRRMEVLWKDATLPNANEPDVTQRTRNLQNEIFRHRADNPPVFSWFYNAIRNKYQKMAKV